MGRETKLLLSLLGLLAGAFVGVLSSKLLVPRPPAGAGPDIHADVDGVPAQAIVAPPELEPVVAAVAPWRTPADEQPAADAELEPLPPPSIDTVPTPVPAVKPAAIPGDRDPAVAIATYVAPVAAVAAPPPAALPAGSHVAGPGDAWWTLAERAYGDGRLYRALFAWNRARDARVSLVPGTPLDIPPLERLRAAWPALVPRD